MAGPLWEVPSAAPIGRLHIDPDKVMPGWLDPYGPWDYPRERSAEYDTELEVLNWCSFLHIAASAADIARQRGVTRWGMARAIYWDDSPLSGERWLEAERFITAMQNGLTSSGVPFGWPVVEYATALGVMIGAEVADFMADELTGSLR